MDVLRDHRRNDLRHDRDDRRVRCNVNRRDHRVMDDHRVNRRSDLRDDDHRLLLDDHHRMGYLCVDDLKMDVNSDVSRGHRMNDLLGDHSMGDVLVGHRKNVMDGRNDLMMDGNLDESHDLRRNDPLDDHLMDGDRHDVLVCHRTNVTGDRNDLKMVVNRVSRSCAPRDLKMDVNLLNRNCGRHDRIPDVNSDVNHGRRTSVPLDDRNLVDDRHDVLDDLRMNGMDDRNDLTMVVSLDVSLCHRMSDRLDDLRMSDRLDDRKMDGNHVNRNCAPRDRKMDVNLDAMSHHVMLMGDQSKSCDRMSHDHLQCDHRMMRRHDTSRNLVVMILDVNHPKTDDPMHLRRVNRRMKVCPKMDDRKMI